MKQLVTILFFIMSTFLASAQEKTPQQKFDNDLKRNTLSLYLLGGIAPRYYEGDKDFVAKYKVKYYDFGCLAPANIKFYEDYNLLVLHHLTEKSGSEWEKDIRKDILGWNKWKKK